MDQAGESNYVVQILPVDSASLPDRRPGRTSAVRETQASSESFAGVQGDHRALRVQRLPEPVSHLECVPPRPTSFAGASLSGMLPPT